MSNKIAIAYIPVLHRGYIDFLRALESEGVTELHLIGDAVLEAQPELDYINRKDRLRAVAMNDLLFAVQAVTSLSVQEYNPEHDFTGATIVMPREDINEVVVGAYLTGADIVYKNVFLRRDKHTVGEEATPEAHATVSATELQRTIWKDVLEEAEKSADWYRRVGAALVKDNEVVYVTHNEHMPEEETPNIEGDARTLFKKGIHINYGTAAHAETVALGAAAKAGIVTQGAELYVTDFPCPYCARLIAAAGIKTVFYLKGYAVLEGDAFLTQAGVELIHLTLDT